MSSLFPESSGATFSPCRRYRYTLWRQWDERPPATFIMLNPSTADETANDPTVERCQRRAQAMGYGGVRVANIFALRSTDPRALYTAEDPVGPENDHALLTLARQPALRALHQVVVSKGGGCAHTEPQSVGATSYPIYSGCWGLPSRFNRNTCSGIPWACRRARTATPRPWWWPCPPHAQMTRPAPCAVMSNA